LPNEYPYDLPGIKEKIFKKDFDSSIDIIPVSDPNIPSNAQRMMLIQMVQQIAAQSPPDMFDMEAINRMLLTTANVPDVDKLMPLKEEAQPQDPLSDIKSANRGNPIKAFKGQNHDAHMQVKGAYIRDPMNQQNPAFQKVAGALQANISEHMMLKYEEQIEGLAMQAMQDPQAQAMLAQMPDPVAAMQAQAAQQLMQANMAMAQQQQAATPEAQMVQLEAQRLGIEQSKVQAGLAKEQVDAALKQRDLDLKEQKIILDAQKAGASEQLRDVQKEEDRNNKRVLKAMDLIGDLVKAQEANEIEESKAVANLLMQFIKEGKNI